MKKISLLHVILAMLCLAGMAGAMPTANSNYAIEYMSGISDAGKWSLGIYAMSMDRDVTYNKRWTRRLETSEYMIYVGYDLFRWITPYVTAGGADSTLDGISGDDGDSGSKIGGGVHFNLFDIEILDPTLFEDRLRVNADVRYTVADVTTGFLETSVEYSELFASLTLSLVNDVWGSKDYWPNSIAVFAGPVFSDIQTSLSDSSVNENDKFGLTAGLEIFLSEKVILNVGILQFDDSGVFGSLNVRF